MDRRIGKYELPDNVSVIAAGNKVEDGAIAYELTSALADRFIHYNAVPSPKDFLAWAKETNIHQSVQIMIKSKPDHLTGGFSKLSEESDNKIVPSPRSWAVVSNVMYSFEDQEDLLHTIIPGIVGQSTANEFFFVIKF